LNKIYAKLKSGEEWITATNLSDVYTALTRFVESSIKYRVVAGNTGTGVKSNYLRKKFLNRAFKKYNVIILLYRSF
jgi:hypothetical protein